MTGRKSSSSEQHAGPRRPWRWCPACTLAAAVAIAVAALLAFGLPHLAKGLRHPSPPADSAALTDEAEGEDGSARLSPQPLAKPAANKLAPFYDALAKLEAGTATEPVTILHLGDSHIASDGITGEMRRLLQARFGDAGRGLMLPGFPFSTYQAPGFSFEKQGTWTAADDFHDAGSYGITGVKLTADTADATLKLVSDSGPFASAEVLLLSGPKGGQAVITAEGWSQQVSTASAKQSELRVVVPVEASSLVVKVVGDGPVTVLGWSLASGRPGIRYVNLGVPGASVYTSRRFDPEIAASDIRELAPKLVVLGFGTMEGFLDDIEFAGYEQEWARLIKLVRSGAPEAALLIIGPPDGARLPPFVTDEARDAAPCRPLAPEELADYAALLSHQDPSLARWHEPPTHVALHAWLARIAGRNGAVYWDMSRVMGGSCSVDRWAKADPPLALPDHIHFTDAGYKQLGQAIYDALMAGYASYRQQASASGSGGD